MDLTPEKILELLSTPLVAGMLLFLGGQVLTRWAGVVKRVVPVILLIVSIIVGVLRGLFPDLVPPVNAAELVATVVHAAPWWVHVLNAVTSAAVAVGLHSGSKNTRQWAEFGFHVLEGNKRK